MRCRAIIIGKRRSQQAFRQSFPTTLDVEKWWALQTVVFTSQSPGPQWTPEISREKLDEILSVAVEFPLQVQQPAQLAWKFPCRQVIQNFESVRQLEILQTKLRDLEMAQFRMAPALAVIPLNIATPWPPTWESRCRDAAGKFIINIRPRATARETLSRLDILDAQRRSLVLELMPFRFQ